jgi:hypothetical protein
MDKTGEIRFERANPSSDFHFNRIQAVEDSKSDMAETDLSEPLIPPAAVAQVRRKHLVPEESPVTYPASKNLPGSGNVQRQAEVPVTPSVMEQMRPFISMVCEELTRALVKTMSEKGNSELISAFIRSVAAQASSRTIMATREVEIHEHRQGRQSNPGVQRNDKAAVPAFTLHDIEENELAEEEDLHEPQP